jgi:putative tryptophan/tyrosine transport system substrate-binding protein
LRSERARSLGRAPYARRRRKVRRIGLLSPNSPSDSALLHQAFRLGLRDLGWVEGKNISIEYRYAEGRSDRFPDLAADLVRLKVDVIVAVVTSDALAAQKATSAIPIVMTSGGDPVATGLVESLARPGGNVTGLSQMISELGGKRVKCNVASNHRQGTQPTLTLRRSNRLGTAPSSGQPG